MERNNNTLRFHCGRCGTIWDPEDHKTNEDVYYGYHCPDCLSEDVGEYVEKEED